MEFKEIKGNQYIVLELNEKVYITTLGETQNVKITNDGLGYVEKKCMKKYILHQ